MWLIVSCVAAIAATAVWSYAPKKYKLENLALMLWGLTVMVFIDHVLGYEGGEFIEMEAEGLIGNGTVLGVAMIIPVFIVWEVQLLLSKLKEGRK
jgi:hypothetical protein